MKILMFGWEFPPHISGGLGTACFGLTQALVKENVNVLFVVPTLYGDEKKGKLTFINASNVTIKRSLQTKSETYPQKPEGSLQKIPIRSALSPYSTTLRTNEPSSLTQWDYQYPSSFLARTKKLKSCCHTFTGGYGENLFEEVKRYADVATELARTTSFDVIHTNDWITYPAGIAAKKVSGKPLVMHVHATEYDRAGENGNPVIYQIEREGLEAADRIIAVSQWTKDIIMKRYQIPAEKIIVIYNGAVFKKHKARTSSPPPIGSHIITFLGRITYQKGPHYFVEAARKVLEKFPQAHFIVAGSGDLLPSTMEHVARLRLSSHFHFTGFLQDDQIEKIWSITNVYIMPSVSEPFGITPLEAIQAGVPVIISHQSGVSEIMHNALKVDFWNTDALAAAIIDVLQHKSLSLKLQHEGAEEIKHITWSAAAKKTNQLYHELSTSF